MPRGQLPEACSETGFRALRVTYLNWTIALSGMRKSLNFCQHGMKTARDTKIILFTSTWQCK
eukprot:scaffold11223_cov57-Attheya_sp.AAC.10